MSIHCLFCGHQANWREDPQGESYEVKVDSNTWVVLNIMKDPLLMEATKHSRPIEQLWAHRDCVQSWLLNLGCETKLNYVPKRL
jgi:hypothetical protein